MTAITVLKDAWVSAAQAAGSLKNAQKLGPEIAATFSAISAVTAAGFKASDLYSNSLTAKKREASKHASKTFPEGRALEAVKKQIASAESVEDLSDLANGLRMATDGKAEADMVRVGGKIGTEVRAEYANSLADVLSPSEESVAEAAASTAKANKIAKILLSVGLVSALAAVYQRNGGVKLPGRQVDGGPKVKPAKPEVPMVDLKPVVPQTPPSTGRPSRRGPRGPWNNGR